MAAEVRGTLDQSGPALLKAGRANEIATGTAERLAAGQAGAHASGSAREAMTVKTPSLPISVHLSVALADGMCL